MGSSVAEGHVVADLFTTGSAPTILGVDVQDCIVQQRVLVEELDCLWVEQLRPSGDTLSPSP